MKLAKYRFLLYSIGIMMLSVGIFACESTMQSPYEDFIKDGEIVYPSKVDSVTIYPGEHRMMVEFLKPEDPTISTARIYWRNEKDSVDVDIGAEQDTVRVIVDGLEQAGTYTVVIHLFDNSGNKSIGQSAVGRVYGDSYASSLRSRPTTAVALDIEETGNIIMDWVPAAEEALGTMVTYTDTNGSEKDLFVSNETSRTEITDLLDQDMSNLEYVTMFKPDPTSIDTFYADAANPEIEEILLKNSAYPFAPVDGQSGKFRDPADWIGNDAVKNRNGQGGWKRNETFGVTAWPGKNDPVVDGKLYKTLTLPAGDYSFEAEVLKGSVDYSTCYVAAAQADSLPDTADLPTESLGYADLNNPEIEFSLSEKSTVSIGVVLNVPNRKAIWFNSFTLNYSR